MGPSEELDDDEEVVGGVVAMTEVDSTLALSAALAFSQVWCTASLPSGESFRHSEAGMLGGLREPRSGWE